MSAAHTPGPWAPVVDFSGEVVLYDATGNDVCTMGGNVNDGANARLIAAAPDLLEALQNMHNVLNEAMSTGGWIPTPVQGSFRDAWVEVTGSIAKATGAQA